MSEMCYKPESEPLLPDQFLDSDGKLPLRWTREYDDCPWDDIRLWMHFNARYCLVTKDLIYCLSEIIAGRPALEIGAGCGDLGRHLGIPMTDNYCQDWPDVRAYYEITQQPTIKYGQAVERIDAVEAVKKYRPKVVVGAWITQWIDPLLPPPPGGGTIYGVREHELIQHVETYVWVGVDRIHKHKRLLEDSRVRVIDADHMVRSRSQSGNKIWIWNRD